MSHPAPDEPGLFDLPLRPLDEPERESPPPRPAPRRPARSGEPSGSLPLFPADEPPASPGAPAAAAPAPAPRPVERPQLLPPPAELPAAPLAARAKAAGGNLLVLAAVVAVQLLGVERLGATLRVADWPAYLAFLLAFSFLYSVIPLAFWGQTPGMVWAGIVARNLDDGPLAFGQTARRWLGGLLSCALLGLPALGALGGRSFSDWVSGSRTLRTAVAAGDEPQPA